MAIILFGCQVVSGEMIPYSKVRCSFDQSIHFFAENEGSIVMEDDMMLLATDDPSNSILKIEIFSSNGEKVSDMNGCYAPNCSINLNTLCSDQYFVIVDTAHGSFFSDYIDVD